MEYVLRDKIVIKRPIVFLCGPYYQKENKVAIAGYEIFENNNYEGTFIFKENNKYYLLLSTGSCLSGLNSTYRVVVATSDSLFGPYLVISFKIACWIL